MLLLATERFFISSVPMRIIFKAGGNMSGSCVADLDQSAFEMSLYRSWPKASTKLTKPRSESSSESSRYEQKPAEPPRTWTMGKFFVEVKKMASRALASVKEEIIQKFTIFKYEMVGNFAINSLKKAATNPNFSERVKSIASFLAYDSQLIHMAKQSGPLPERVLGNYAEQLVELVQSGFDGLDEFVQSTYNTCTYPGVKTEVYSELAPLHNSMARLIEFYVTTEKHCEIIKNHCSYIEL